MDKSSFKKANAFITHGGDAQDLQAIHAKIKMLERLSQKVLPLLDSSLAKYCQVANLTNGKLILIAANGSIATQIRFQANEILGKLSKDNSIWQIKGIECKVRPPQPRLSPRLQATPAKHMAALSPETAQIVKSMAELIEDPKLREIMERIAGRVKG